MQPDSGGYKKGDEEVLADAPATRRVAYRVLQKVGWYGWWQMISLIYTIGLGCAAIGDDLSSVTVPLLRWRALVLCGFVYSGVFATGWAICLMRMISRDTFRTQFTDRVDATDKRAMVKGAYDSSTALGHELSSIWTRTAAITGMQLFYYVAMFLVYGMASTYSVFIYTYTDDANVDGLQHAIDQGYSKGAQFMTYAVHKKISMLVWLQIAMLVSICLSASSAMLARFTVRSSETEQKVVKYNALAFMEPHTKESTADVAAGKSTTQRRKPHKSDSEMSQKEIDSLSKIKLIAP